MKITNKKRFTRAMIHIAIMIIMIVAINLFANHLIANGISTLFTTNIYEEAFQTNEADIFFINFLRIILTVGTIYTCYVNLEYQGEMAECEKSEKNLLRMVVNVNG